MIYNSYFVLITFEFFCLKTNKQKNNSLVISQKFLYICRTLEFVWRHYCNTQMLQAFFLVIKLYSHVTTRKLFLPTTSLGYVKCLLQNVINNNIAEVTYGAYSIYTFPLIPWLLDRKKKIKVLKSCPSLPSNVAKESLGQLQIIVTHRPPASDSKAHRPSAQY